MRVPRKVCNSPPTSPETFAVCPPSFHRLYPRSHRHFRERKRTMSSLKKMMMMLRAHSSFHQMMMGTQSFCGPCSHLGGHICIVHNGRQKTGALSLSNPAELAHIIQIFLGYPRTRMDGFTLPNCEHIHLMCTGILSPK